MNDCGQQCVGVHHAFSPFLTCSVVLHFPGLREYPVRQVKEAGSKQLGGEETPCDPQRQAAGSGPEEAEADGGESKLKDSDCRPDREVRVELQGSELWKRFYEIGTEMIITKAGR